MSGASGLIVGIDASRNRSGGARAHLIGILSSLDPEQYGIREVHVWSFKALLDELPSQPWLVKHNPPSLEMSLAAQIFHQAICLAEEVRAAHCDILFTTDASTLCLFQPMVVLSQDMLSYEPGVMEGIGYGRSHARLLAILYLQNFAFRRAQGVIFLTHYAGRVIQRTCGSLKNVAYIPHGVGANFQGIVSMTKYPELGTRPVRIIYVSNTAQYKYQWNVVKAVAQLRQIGMSLELELVGGGDGKAQARLDAQVMESDPLGEFVSQRDFVPQNTLPNLLAQADLFVFASSCETFGITLLEAMAVGLPIACSNRSSLPETLADGGVYFDPENPDSIAAAIDELVSDKDKRIQLARRAKDISRQYSWSRCAQETFAFIVQTANQVKQGKLR